MSNILSCLKTNDINKKEEIHLHYYYYYITESLADYEKYLVKDGHIDELVWFKDL